MIDQVMIGASFIGQRLSRPAEEPGMREHAGGAPGFLRLPDDQVFGFLGPRGTRKPSLGKLHLFRPRLCSFGRGSARTRAMEEVGGVPLGEVRDSRGEHGGRQRAQQHPPPRHAPIGHRHRSLPTLAPLSRYYAMFMDDYSKLMTGRGRSLDHGADCDITYPCLRSSWSLNSTDCDVGMAPSRRSTGFPSAYRPARSLASWGRTARASPKSDIDTSFWHFAFLAFRCVKAMRKMLLPRMARRRAARLRQRPGRARWRRGSGRALACLAAARLSGSRPGCASAPAGRRGGCAGSSRLC
jgi:hypothetical protein